MTRCCEPQHSLLTSLSIASCLYTIRNINTNLSWTATSSCIFVEPQSCQGTRQVPVQHQSALLPMHRLVEYTFPTTACSTHSA